ncbi:F-box protein At5g07610-like [Triticum aestivum]|uniref:F-box protein At5g07610-like n=1 Tax=Triticum aestivum TaxID=4565 RepID=UPI001D031BE7|nr:F-box protein At5g07610-like [Triticum aestivum]
MDGSYLLEGTVKEPDGLLVKIISRVPYKSTCCCKCVSTRWRDLFSHPDHRKKMPQSLAGFFYEGYNRNRFPKEARYFTNVSGEGDPLIDPSLSFLAKCESLAILDCCNGLLLCRCGKATDPNTMDYVVCNPATEKWVVVPATDWSCKVSVARLGFEPAVSSHFHVFEFIDQKTWGIDDGKLNNH